MYRLKWLGIFDNVPVGLKRGTPAQVLEHILKKKWTLKEDDNDMIVMWHKFNYYRDGGSMKEFHSTMVAVGEDKDNTGMAKTVGLPMGIVAKLMLDDLISLTGVHIPIHKEIYDPVLSELAELGFHFIEEEIS
jgi:saccharopine dehydrogenase (NADP+, L-glutamate forming)